MGHTSNSLSVTQSRTPAPGVCGSAATSCSAGRCLGLRVVVALVVSLSWPLDGDRHRLTVD